MKVCKALILLSLFMVAFYNCAPPPDEDTKEETGEDTTTAELPWTGETDKFTINTKEGVHLNDPEEDAGTAYITFPSSSVPNTRWEFGVRLTFNPSANNYARFYLTSSSNVLSGELTGYFIQIGGAKDNVALYRQNGAELKLLASGRELMKGNSSPKLYVKVECDNNGYWTFWTRLLSEEEYTKEKQIKDSSIQNSVCCGIYCVYTKTRCDGFTFHHIQLSNDVETTTEPGETPDHPEEPETPEKPVLPDYPEEVKNLLLLNEIMYDNATYGAEYIELYNPSNSTVSVPSLKLLRYIDNGSGTTQTTTTAILKHPDKNQRLDFPPHGYICLTKSAATLINKHKADKNNIIQISTFPRINNDGGYLPITTNEEKPRIIDKCIYSDKMHNEGVRNQGVSLEKKSPELKSALKSNWSSSKNATGGTPGRKNEQE